MMNWGILDMMKHKGIILLLAVGLLVISLIMLLFGKTGYKSSYYEYSIDLSNLSIASDEVVDDFLSKVNSSKDMSKYTINTNAYLNERNVTKTENGVTLDDGKVKVDYKIKASIFSKSGTEMLDKYSNYIEITDENLEELYVSETGAVGIIKDGNLDGYILTDNKFNVLAEIYLEHDKTGRIILKKEIISNTGLMAGNQKTEGK